MPCLDLGAKIFSLSNITAQKSSTVKANPMPLMEGNFIH